MKCFYFSIGNPPKNIYKINPDERKLTVAEIVEKFLKEKNVVWIKCPNFAIPLFNEEVPFPKYPGLLFESRPGPYFTPSYSFQIYKSIPSSSIILFFNVSHNSKMHFPKIGFPIPKSVLGQNLSLFFFEIMNKNLCKGIQPKEIFIREQKVDPSSSIRSIYEASSNSDLFVLCDLDKSICEIMRQRDNVVKEIITTEKTFIDSIKTIVDLWHPKLKALNILTKDDEDLIFKNFPSILAYHQSFYVSLINHYNDYATLIARLFVEFSQFFKASIQYVSNYPQISETIKRLGATKLFKEAELSISKQCGNRDFGSYLITPVQRMPRYSLLMNELKKFTNEFHPDYIFIDEASKILKNITQEYDKKTEILQSKSILMKLQEKNKNNFVFVTPSRQILGNYKVKINGKLNEYIIFVCNDIIFITKNSYKLMYHTKLITFDFNIINHQNIIINNSTESKMNLLNIKFETKNQFNEFIDKLYLRMNIFLQKNSDKKLLLWIKLPISNELNPICNHYCIPFNDLFYFFCPNLQKKQMEIYTLTNGKINNIQCKQMLSRKKHTINCYESFAYIIGGSIKTDDSYIIKYDLINQKFSYMENLTKIQLHGHTSVIYNKKIFIFGGKITSKQLTNEIVIIDLERNNSKTLCKFNIEPDPRCNHSAIVYNDQMIIYGGKNGIKIFNDVWRFDLIHYEWIKVCDIQYRTSHKCFMIGDEMIVIGGLSNTKNCESFSFNVKTLKIKPIIDIGNVPNNIKDFAFGINDNYEIVLYCGVQNKTISSSVYSIKLNQKWTEKLSKNCLNDSQKIKIIKSAFNETDIGLLYNKKVENDISQCNTSQLPDFNTLDVVNYIDEVTLDKTKKDLSQISGILSNRENNVKTDLNISENEKYNSKKVLDKFEIKFDNENENLNANETNDSKLLNTSKNKKESYNNSKVLDKFEIKFDNENENLNETNDSKLLGTSKNKTENYNNSKKVLDKFEIKFDNENLNANETNDSKLLNTSKSKKESYNNSKVLDKFEIKFDNENENENLNANEANDSKLLNTSKNKTENYNNSKKVLDKFEIKFDNENENENLDAAEAIKERQAKSLFATEVNNKKVINTKENKNEIANKVINNKKCLNTSEIKVRSIKMDFSIPEFNEEETNAKKHSSAAKSAKESKANSKEQTITKEKPNDSRKPKTAIKTSTTQIRKRKQIPQQSIKEAEKPIPKTNLNPKRKQNPIRASITSNASSVRSNFTQKEIPKQQTKTNPKTSLRTNINLNQRHNVKPLNKETNLKPKTRKPELMKEKKSEVSTPKSNVSIEISIPEQIEEKNNCVPMSPLKETNIVSVEAIKPKSARRKSVTSTASILEKGKKCNNENVKRNIVEQKKRTVAKFTAARAQLNRNASVTRNALHQNGRAAAIRSSRNMN